MPSLLIQLSELVFSFFHGAFYCIYVLVPTVDATNKMGYKKDILVLDSYTFLGA